MSSLAQLQVQDTEEQKQRRHKAEFRNARSEQLLMIPTEQLIDWK